MCFNYKHDYLVMFGSSLSFPYQVINDPNLTKQCCDYYYFFLENNTKLVPREDQGTRLDIHLLTRT